jgi:hypothetical protein
MTSFFTAAHGPVHYAERVRGIPVCKSHPYECWTLETSYVTCPLCLEWLRMREQAT